MRIVAAIIISVVLLVVLAMEQPHPLVYLAVPVCLAASLATILRHSPGRAFMTGALTTFGIILVATLPIIVILALGGYDSGESCENGCVGDAERFVLALLVPAVPAAIVGGIVSSLASRGLVRPMGGAQP